MYRRPTAVCFCKLCEVTHRQDVAELDQDELFRLPRAAADELVVASVLAPLMASNLAAELRPKLYASDASLAKGAVVSAPLAGSAERKGGYSRLESA